MSITGPSWTSCFMCTSICLCAEYGYHTNKDGHFEPVGQCIMGLRYRVKQKLDTKGHSAVLVLAEVGESEVHL